MAATENYVKLAQSLPPQLLRFFARYPPASIHRPLTSSPPATTLTTSSFDPNPPHVETDVSIELSSPAKAYNPFKPRKHPVTGAWHGPVFSLRRQADLVKLARNHGVEELLPHTIKKTEERLKKREQYGLRVRGTGVGQKVKGKAHERTLKTRLDRRKQAMLEMPAMIQQWKEVTSFSLLFEGHRTKIRSGWTRTWMEEMAKMTSCGLLSDFASHLRVVYLVFRKRGVWIKGECNILEDSSEMHLLS